MKEQAMDRNITIGDKYQPAMEIQTEVEAKNYLERCIEHTMRFGKNREEAERTERFNIGYYSGYYGTDVQQRVERLYGVVHPVFESINREDNTDDR